MSGRLPAGTRLGPYEIEGLIGAGGMGEVFRARDTRLGRRVAIKTLAAAAAADPGRIARFETEARAAGAVDHPNLLSVYDVGHEGAISYIVSELLEGQTLRDRLLGGPLPERQVLEFAAQMADGLAAAHARGIVHRDLKPANLFVTSQRRLKILDFGVAKLTQASDPDLATATSPPETGAGVTVGTVGYMAPEQVRGEPVDHRADIFAFGVVVHEMLSGAAPFRRDSAAETMTAILREEPPDLPPGVTPALQRVLRQCLEKDAVDRFHSAHDLGVALRVISSTGGSGVAATVKRPAAVTRRTALIYGASSLLLAGTGVVSATWLGTRRGPVVPSFRRITFRRGLIRGTRLAPDGQTVVYGAHWDGGPCRVHVSRIDRPESHPLDLPDANVLAISRTGEIAIALGSHLEGAMPYGTLARVPMAGGVPRQMIEDVKFADWSPDGENLAVVRRVDGRDRLEFPIGNVLVAPDDGSGLAFPRLSKDARVVAYIRHNAPASLTGRVEMVDLAGSVSQTTGEYLTIHGLAWKGEEVWFTAAGERPMFRSLWSVTPGGAVRAIAQTPSNGSLWDISADGRLVMAHIDDRAVLIVNHPDHGGERDLSWFDLSQLEDLSRDGRLVLFTEAGQGGGADSSVYVRGTDGAAAVRLGDGRGIALSPDARWALCGTRTSPSPYLEVVPIGAGESRRIPGDGFNYFSARWLPDGERIVVSASEPGHGIRLYVQELGSGRRTPLTPEQIRGFNWTVSPDGSMVAAAAPGPGVSLYPVDGSPSRQLPGTTGRDIPIAWINDGLLIRRLGEPGTSFGDVFRVDIASGRQEFWKNVLPRDRAGLISLGSFRTQPDGRAQAHTFARALGTLYVADGFS